MIAQTDFFVGVPDSKLKDFLKDKKYLVVADEGEAVGVAAGYYLATGKKATVFMSADGFCNALNPITSLLIPYKIPCDLVISKRDDEPQHKVIHDSIHQIIKAVVGDGISTLNYLIF